MTTDLPELFGLRLVIIILPDLPSSRINRYGPPGTIFFSTGNLNEPCHSESFDLGSTLKSIQMEIFSMIVESPFFIFP